MKFTGLMSVIKILMVLLMIGCEPKDETPPLIYHQFQVVLTPEEGGILEVYDVLKDELIENYDSLLEGTRVKIKAIPNSGYRVSGIMGNGKIIPEEEPTLIIARDNTIEVTFIQNVGNPVDIYGQLSIDGAKIVDKNKRHIQLRGMSFFWSQWIGKYYTPGVVEWLANDWEANIVRAAMGGGSKQYRLCF